MSIYRRDGLKIYQIRPCIVSRFNKATVFTVLFVVVRSFLVYLLYRKTAFLTYYLGKRGVRIERNISYVEGGNDSAQMLDLYVPKNEKNYVGFRNSVSYRHFHIFGCGLV